jgi:competence protein ComFC
MNVTGMRAAREGVVRFRVGSILRPIREFILPPLCVVCNNPRSSGDERVCAQCWRTITPLTSEDPLFVDMKKRLSADGAISSLVSTFLFEKDGTLQSLIHLLKYDGMTTLGVLLGERLAKSLEMSVGIENLTMLVPVPLHRVKQRERGYNQSVYICRGIARTLGVRVFPTLLQRRRYTQSQTHLDARERKENVRDAFHIRAEVSGIIRGGTFVVVDDVITTGATMLECARALKSHGAANVIACSLALADLPSIP